MTVDSDVLIWYMKGNNNAKNALDEIGVYAISSVVYMEIIQGVRNKAELKSIKQFFEAKHTKILPINPEITSRAIYFMETYSSSHGLRMADALIASTADNANDTLLTANIAHYQMIPHLLLKTFRP